MRNLKRALSLVMAMALIVGMMVVSASAASKDFTDSSEIQHKEAVNTMVALNVISGKEDGSYFDPNGTLTRAEMAKIVAYVMNGGVEPNIGTKLVPTYSDIDNHWAEAYIEYCTSMGIINGDGAGKFNPEGTLTASQAAKMFLTAMGYNATVFGFTGNSWETNTNRYANEAGLYEDLGNVAVSQPISRDNAAQMAYNAIQAKMMERDWSLNPATGEMTEGYKLGNNTLLSSKFGAKVLVGTFEGNNSTGASGAAKGEIQVKGWLTTDDKATDPVKTANFPFDLDISYIGEEFKVIFKDGTSGSPNKPDKYDTIYGVFNTGATTVYRVAKGDLQDAGATNLANGKIKFNDTVYDVAAGAGTASSSDTMIITNYGAVADVTANTIGGGTSGCTAAQFATYINTPANGLRVNSADTIKFVANENGEIFRAYVESWTYSKVLSKTDSKIQLEGFGSRDLEDVNFIDEVAVDSLVAVADFYGTGSTQTQVKAAQTVTGTVEAMRNGTELQINGTWYDASVNTEGLTDYGAQTYSVGDEYELVLDGDAYYVAGKVVSASSNYGVVLKSSTGINDQVKLLLADGSEKTFIINSDSALQQGSLSNGQMVKYELLKNDTEVKMSSASKATDSDGSNDHSFNKDTKVLTVYGASKVGDYVVSSDAVAFVYNSTTSKWKAFNANTISSITANASTDAYYVLKSGKVVAFALTDTAFPTGSGSSSGYGYVTDVISTKVDDSNVVQLIVWNGSENATVTVDGSTVSIAKGDFVKYTVSTAPIAASEVVKADDGTSNFTSVKVKEYDPSRNLVITTTGTYSVTGDMVNDVESVYTVDANTQIIGVKSADKKGSDYNTITSFTKVSGEDYNNAYVIYELDGTTKVIKAIFVDEDNAITVGGSKTGNAGSPVNVAGLAETTYNTGAKVAISANKTQALVGETVTFTLTLSGTSDATTTKAITITGATLTNGSLTGTGVSGVTSVVISGTNTITITPTAAATTGTYTFTGVVTGAVSFS